MIENEQEKQRAFHQLEIIGKVIEREESSFLNLGSVSIALVVILTLGKDLVVFSEREGKVLLSIFLIIPTVIPVYFFYSYNTAKNKSLKIINDILKKDVVNELNINCFVKVFSRVPLFLITIFVVCTSYVIYAIWR